MEQAVATPNPAPALARGLDLLRHLDAHGPSSLEDLARATGFPKSSVARILHSLELAAAVERHPATRRYHARLRLAPVAPTGRLSLPEAASPVMDQLARQTRHTVELYNAQPLGPAMIARREPDDAPVAVRARVGFVRDLHEIEAVCQVTRVFAPHPDQPADRLWHWDSGVKCNDTAEQLQRVLDTTRHALAAVDLGINEYGIRRYAAPIREDDRLLGTLALAQFCPPTASQPDPQLLEAVRTAAARIHR